MYVAGYPPFGNSVKARAGYTHVVSANKTPLWNGSSATRKGRWDRKAGLARVGHQRGSGGPSPWSVGVVDVDISPLGTGDGLRRSFGMCVVGYAKLSSVANPCLDWTTGLGVVRRRLRWVLASLSWRVRCVAALVGLRCANGALWGACVGDVGGPCLQGGFVSAGVLIPRRCGAIV